jgi:uncharacterized protein YaeQ
MMARLVAFCLFAHERLAFTKGLSSDEEPDLWQHSLAGEIELWVEVGQPDERRIRKACGRALDVAVLSYGGRAAELWWQQNAGALGRLDNLRVLDLPADRVQALAAMAERTMDLQCTIADGTLWIGNGETTVELTPTVRQG